jgi:arsenite oxidase small subunit
MTQGEDEAERERQADDSKRAFIKLAITASAILAAGGVGVITRSVTNAASTPVLSFPRIKVASLSQLSDNQALTFSYPLDNTPNILMKLGAKAESGVGPDGDVVAFSQLCQHLGCVYGVQPTGTSPKCNSSYVAKGPVGYCCCHGSVYDLANGGKVIGGPAPRPLPMVVLEVDTSGDIYAVGMTPPTIFGHNTGSNDVSADLQGGDLVTQ